MKRMVCLANSRKYSGRCVAGKQFPAPGAWLRPISARSTGELSDDERRYKDGSLPQLLDVIDVPIRAPAPHSFQTENVEIDPTRRWTKVGTFPLASLHALLDPPSVLWNPGDRIPLEQARTFRESLRLVLVEAVTLSIRSEDVARWQVRGAFNFSGESYNLPVTDPEIEQRAFLNPDQEIRLSQSFLTISLGEPFYNHCYKLVAAILPTPL